MMDVRRIKPVRGKTVPYPTPPYALVPEDGARVEFPGPSSYWARRVNSGEVEIIPDVQTTADAKPGKARKED